MLIDPLVRFGRPAVDGVATDRLWELYDAGESLEEIGDGYDMSIEVVRSAVVSCDRPSSMRNSSARWLPFRSLAALREGVTRKPAEFAVDEFLSWSDGASFPLIPTERAVAVFQRLRTHPRLDVGGPGWAPRPTTEFHATNDKRFFDFDPMDTDRLWPVYKGASFNLWAPDTGIYYAWADPDEVTAVLHDKRLRSRRRANSVWAGIDAEYLQDPDTLPCRAPRIAFRDVARATDTRTVIAALVPGSIVLNHKAPYLVRPHGDERDEAFLLGLLCSIPLDWYARRVVEISLTYHVLNGFPIPAADRESPQRRRVEELGGRLAFESQSSRSCRRSGMPRYSSATAGAL